MTLLKLVLAPALVVVSSLAGRRWGPELAGALVALPIVAGPILFITYLAVATGGLALALTGAAARRGPGLTGVLAPFPTGTSVVAAFA